MNKYKKVAESVIKNIGGQDNVESLTHCATRLRFTIKNSNDVSISDLKNVDGVLTVVSNGSSLQVVIGNDVKKVFDEISLIKVNQEKPDTIDSLEKSNSPKIKRSFIEIFMDTISGVFTPIMVALSASGLLKALLLVLVTFKWVDSTSTTYQLFNTLSDAVFFFLPVLLAVSSANKFKANLYISLLLAVAFLHPNFIVLFNSGDPVSLFGFNLPKVVYSSSVIPIILSVFLQSKIENKLNDWIPDMFKLLLVPFLTIIIVYPITLGIIGPIGIYIGNILADIITMIQTQFGWVAVGIVAMIRPVLVIFGMHYALLPITTANFTANGYEMLTRPATLVGTIAQGGSALAVAVKTKNKATKSLAYQTGVTALFGITEPAMYGINLKYKKPFYCALVSGGIGGLFAGATAVKAISLGMTGILTLPVFIGETFVYAVLASILTFVLAFVSTYFVGFDDTIK